MVVVVPVPFRLPGVVELALVGAGRGRLGVAAASAAAAVVRLTLNRSRKRILDTRFCSETIASMQREKNDNDEKKLVYGRTKD